MNQGPQHSNSQEQKLTMIEAERRVWEAVDELEEVINLLNGTPGLENEARRENLAAASMSLLATRFNIAP